MSKHGEDKLRNRVVFKLTGRWSRSVVESRVADTSWDPTNVNAIMRSIWEEAGRGDEAPLFTGRGDERR